MLIVWAIVMRALRREAEEAKMLNSLQAAHAATTWKIEKEKEPLSINVATVQQQLHKIKFSQLIEATNGFSAASLIGCGGFGEVHHRKFPLNGTFCPKFWLWLLQVFKATLKDGSCVAIKKLIHLSYQGDREFMAEMETLGLSTKPGAAARILQGAGGAAPRLRVHAPRQPRGHAPLTAHQQGCRTRPQLGGAKADRPQRSKGPLLPPPQLHPPHHPSGHEVHQCAAGCADGGARLRLRHGPAHQRPRHPPQRQHAHRHTELRSAGVLPELPLHGQGGRVLLRGHPARAAHRAMAGDVAAAVVVAYCYSL
ncbi:hypothetical protein ZIOFF_063398 [Zingiber officinale]|uniref:non-specific serine/threonine protein kinase n=1 Tax=Zingiber officinale TaxID=94328 RepID=A0A8J5KGG8_ZINOF|nr:hypothetical protein ZIOFF_063398 [Zingiber officinale]